MSDGLGLQLITCLYLGCNATRLLAYAPQIRALLNEARPDRASVVSSVVFAIANGSTFGYALATGSGPLMVGYAAANSIASLLVVALASRLHWCERGRGRRPTRLPCGEAHTTGFFYAAGHAAHPAQAATAPVTSADSMRPSSIPWQATSAAPCRVSSGRSILQRSLA
jgi:hypothetical protein